MTSHATSGIERAGSPLLCAYEYAERDVAKHERLARAQWPVTVLSEATHGDRERSPRYRSLLRPMGIEHEMRAAVRERGTTWGFLHLFRRPGRPDFDAGEAALVERFARGIAPALRRALVGEQTAQPSQPAELVSLMLSHYRFTPAEGQIARLVLAGRSTREIAGELVVSPHTVQDHLKAVFHKAGVRSRRDLVARLTGAAA